MAAPRTYSDEQRAVMFRLYQAGEGATAITRMCEEGTAGCAPFTAKRRRVQEIVTEMAREAGQEPPKTVAHLGNHEAINGFPERSLALIEGEMTRLERKQARGSRLSSQDAECIGKMVRVLPAIERRLKRSASTTRAGRQRGAKEAPRESAVEQLAREESERAGDETQLSRTRTPKEHDETDLQLEPDVATKPDVATSADARERRRQIAQEALDTMRAIAKEDGTWTPELEAIRVPDTLPEPALAADPPGFTPSQERIFAARTKGGSEGSGSER